MKVLVCGGAGFIGQRVVRCLVEGGHDVLALVRGAEKAALVERIGASPRIGDLADPVALRQAMQGAEVVVNLAVPSFLGRLGSRRTRALARQAFAQMKTLLETAAAAGGVPLILTEGTLALGESLGECLDETAPYDLRGYARIGRLSIPFGRSFVQENNLPVVKMLPGGVYGAESWFKESIYDLMKKGWCRTLGDGRNELSFVHVDDVAEGYRLAVEKLPVGRSFALVDDEPCRVVDFVNCVAESMGKSPVKSLPPWLAKLVAGGVVVEAMTVNCKVRNQRAKEELGWTLRYPTYREGIPVAVAEIEA